MSDWGFKLNYIFVKKLTFIKKGIPLTTRNGKGSPKKGL